MIKSARAFTIVGICCISGFCAVYLLLELGSSETESPSSLVNIGTGSQPGSNSEQGKVASSDNSNGKVPSSNDFASRVTQFSDGRLKLYAELSAKVEPFSEKELLRVQEKCLEDASLIAGLAFYAPAAAEQLLSDPATLARLAARDIAVLLSRNEFSGDTRQALLNTWVTKHPDDNVAKYYTVVESILAGQKTTLDESLGMSGDELMPYNSSCADALKKLYLECGRPADASSAAAMLKGGSIFSSQINEMLDRLASGNKDMRKVMAGDPDARETVLGFISNLSASASIDWTDFDKIIQIQSLVDRIEFEQGLINRNESQARLAELRSYSSRINQLAALPEMRSQLSGTDADRFDELLKQGPNGGILAAEWFSVAKPELYNALKTIGVYAE
jgi:hypothetical protein